MSSIIRKIPIIVMIGGGSKLPKLIRAAKSPKSKFRIVLVVTHKKNSNGINIAIKNNIPAAYFNLVDWRVRVGKTRKEYMKYLGWFISQKSYNPKLLVFAGWDLVMDKNFFDHFKTKMGNGYAAINLHPALMKINGENDIKLPDGSRVPVIKGEQEAVLKEVIKRKYTYFGPSVHFMIPTEFDTGKVIERKFIKVGRIKKINQLQKKLMPAEDSILISAINKVVNSL